MKYIVRLFAVIGFLFVLVVGLVVWAATNLKPRAQAEPSNVVLYLDFTRPVVEQAESSPFAFAMNDEPMALLDILRAVDRAKADDKVKGIVARFGAAQPGLAQTQEIRAALARFRESGKFTYAYGTDFGQFGTGNRAYMLASAFEEIWLQPVGTVSLTGVAMNNVFGKSALEKAGVTADFMQREEYKSFMERAQRDSFSPLVKAEMQGLVENLGNQIAVTIAESRKMELSRVKQLMAEGPYTGEEAKEAGLITRIAYADELEDEIDKKAGKDEKLVEPAAYLMFAGAADKAEPKAKGASTRVAVIDAIGMISDKEIGGGLASEKIVGADEVSQAFRDAVEDKGVKAILFRIDSPGGSPAASETVRRAVMRAQKKGKPVIVSMGDMAASGGYWMAMNGTRIIANPSTLTGSIGVVSGKFADNGLMQKLGLSIDGVSTADNAGMWSLHAGFTPGQRARVNAMMDDVYHSFVRNVSTARKIPMEKMPDLAKGRVFTGEQAVKLGLVDELGGYDVAMAAVRKELKLEDKDVLSLESFPAEQTPIAKIKKMLRSFGAQSAAMASMGEAWSRVMSVAAPVLNAAMLNQPVVARMPYMGELHD